MNQGPNLLARNCPNCGGNLDGAPPGRTIVCRYCGHSFQTAPEFNPPPRVIVISPNLPRRPVVAARKAAGVSVLGIFLMIFALGLAAFLSARGRARSALENLPSQLVAAAAADFMWDTVAGPPIPAAVGGGGVEGFVGRIRTRGDDVLYIAAFEGTKLGQVWKAGPLGTYTQAYQSTFASVLERSVVVTDYRANLHVYDLATGHETRTLKLTDRAKGLCTAPSGRARVWIEMSDEKNVVFDLDAGTLAPATRPAWCGQGETSGDCRGWLTRGAPRQGCAGPEGAPKVNAFQAENVIEEGDLAVALGKKHPGTALPIAVGFDPKTKAVRWQAPVGSGDQAAVAESSTTSVMDALAGGRFVVPYEVTSKGWHFTAFDARSGQRLWDVPLASIIGIEDPEGFSLSAARVYVMRSSSLEVYDAKTGALVGTLGG
jgi:putative pyrroloquinoline-quinone binding quinoprotein